MFRSRHYIVCHPTIVNISYNTFHFSLLFLVILTYCLNVVSSCLYIIPLFYKNQVQFNQFQKNPLWFLSPKRIFLFLSIFHYFSLLFYCKTPYLPYEKKRKLSLSSFNNDLFILHLCGNCLFWWFPS